MKSLLLFICIPIVIIAQNSKDVVSITENYITTDLLSPFYTNVYKGSDANMPRLRFGFIKTISKKTKLGGTIGVGFRSSILGQTGNNYTLWEIRPEYYHVFNPKRKTLKYFSVEVFYLNHRELFTNQYFQTSTHKYLRFDQAAYTRQKFGVIPKLGMFINLSDRLGLNLYMGMGLAYKHNNYTDFTNLRNHNFDEEHFSPYYRKEGLGIRGEFSFGFKLYYRIKEN